MHFVLLPVALISLAIGPDILSISGDLILEEGPGIDASVGEGESTFSVLLSVFVASVVARSIRPGLDTLAMLLVFEPLADVGGSVCVSIRSLTMSFIIQPHAFIDVTICVNERAHTIGLVVLPHAVVAGRVWPDLHTVTMLLAVHAFARVSRAIHVRGGSHIGELVIRLELGRAAVASILALGTASLGKLAIIWLHSVFDLKLLALLVDIGGGVRASFALFLLDSDFALPVGSFRDAVACAISHFLSINKNLI